MMYSVFITCIYVSKPYPYLSITYPYMAMSWPQLAWTLGHLVNPSDMRPMTTSGLLAASGRATQDPGTPFRKLNPSEPI